MIRLLIRVAINLATAALGLLVASWVIPGVTLSASGFTVAVVVFAIAQTLLGPFVFNIARKYADAILGGIGLVTTFLALFVATLFPGGLRIEGVTAWLLAPLVVWVITALGGWILAAIFLKKTVQKAKGAQ
ncbi:phage holin family protein [Microbacterium sp. NC79]|uniref:phage holin family protein n=1 Tax=Microbacterium sp. NC79 TaxID=2851009 RepID=UPI001C2C33D9|nr:phage holin family protein [Microbacterium sp. NC79]MBV0895438.1 phage holin family protein [Microbacterium sp. NC79]